MSTVSTPPSSPGSHANSSIKNAQSLCDDGSPLSRQRAVTIATKMCTGLAPQTKDRMWHFKTYRDCFKNSHAIAWAKKNIHPSEDVAVNVLNQLVDFGLVCHVVDPHKKFKVEDTRTLYFRVAKVVCGGETDLLALEEEEDENDLNQQPRNNALSGTRPLLNGSFGSMIDRRTSKAMKTRMDNLEHVLQETVEELNAVQGKLEIVHQEVVSIVGQQLSVLVLVVFLYLYVMFVVVPSVPGMDWWSVPGVSAMVMLFMSTRCGFACVALWGHLDSRIVPIEEVNDEESTQTSVVKNAAFIRQSKTATSFQGLISRSIRTTSFQRMSEEKDLIVVRDSYSLPEVTTWPNRPIFICMNTPISPSFKVPDYGLGPCPLGVPFQFSSELFEGTCLIRVKGSNSDNPEGDSEYFSGKKRIFQSVVQGRFKEDVRVSDVLTGHEFVRPLKNLPHPWVLKTASNFISKVAPGSNVVIHTDQPKVEAILAGTSQVIRGDEPGNEPNITTCNIQEDCSVLGGTFAKGDVSISRRKRLLSNPERSKKYMFDTETTYTFEFYQNLFDAMTYSLDIGFTKIGCSRVLDGQPIQWLGKMRDGRYLWSFQIWHEKLLTAQHG
mmetsp:Transcript_33744/g.68776  ORF Transcript_33744/g.68776 Transcript_33744/m.68776 type:complete len:607 (-) Transcript_33744:144-1964(-)